MCFKKCTSCTASWSSREDFLADPGIKLVGYQSWLDDLELGLFLFNHDTCGTTLALQASAFTDLYNGPVFAGSGKLMGTDACSTYCLNSSDLRPCPKECECAYVRQVLQIVRNWPKERDSGVRQAPR